MNTKKNQLRNMKKFISSFILIVILTLPYITNAQIFSVGASGITLTSGTVLYGDGLIITPSADITLTSISLSRNTTVSHTTSNSYISRVYQFNANTAPFSGTVQINYIVPGELNSIPESNLQLNIHNGTLWQAFTGTVNTTSNYVLSNPISNIVLNELTLANVLTPLPLKWVSFTAAKEKTSVLLQWITLNEEFTKDFIVQYSTDGMRWINLTTILRNPGTGNRQEYNYIHSTPVEGINYYRILQNDLDGRSSYSILRTVKFSGNADAFYLPENSVKNGRLQVQVTGPVVLFLYTADGKLISQHKLSAGLQAIDVSTYSKGIYLLSGNGSTIKFNIQ